jgi:hypothetical protein
MGPSLVVVSAVDPEDPLEVAPAQHEHPVKYTRSGPFSPIARRTRSLAVPGSAS